LIESFQCRYLNDRTGLDGLNEARIIRANWPAGRSANMRARDRDTTI
jgi:hypothetical protein